MVRDPLARRDTPPVGRLVVAQDTGGAIRGQARTDFFQGWGHEAGERAGRMRDEAEVFVLLPRVAEQANGRRRSSGAWTVPARREDARRRKRRAARVHDHAREARIQGRPRLSAPHGWRRRPSCRAISDRMALAMGVPAPEEVDASAAHGRSVEPRSVFPSIGRSAAAPRGASGPSARPGNAKARAIGSDGRLDATPAFGTTPAARLGSESWMPRWSSSRRMAWRARGWTRSRCDRAPTSGCSTRISARRRAVASRARARLCRQARGGTRAGGRAPAAEEAMARLVRFNLRYTRRIRNSWPC